MLDCQCTRTLKHRRDQKTFYAWGLEGSVAPRPYERGYSRYIVPGPDTEGTLECLLLAN